MSHTLECAIGIMAHNEEANAGHLLDRLLEQRLERVRIARIIVVASGCTDRTEAVVRERAARSDLVRLVSEPRRRGKAAAINAFLSLADTDICVLQGADTLPRPETIERLVRPFEDPGVGMTGARIVPLNSKSDFPGYVVHFLWELHHQVALLQPKCGELVAFRRVFDALPADTVVDEPQIEAFVRAAGLRAVYAPEAVVYNLGPDSIREIVMRRRSITAGYAALGRRTAYRTSTQARLTVARIVAERILDGREPLLPALGACAVEAASRALGHLDAAARRPRMHVWDMAKSTKRPADFLPPEE
jgi:cellulose synthase/poly-beta-1,6-N-acetylglucosamine synthase-like glycosyltransferase